MTDRTRIQPHSGADHRDQTITITTPSGRDTIAHAKHFQMGFLSRDEVQAIAADPATRLRLVLVRCGGGRFLAPAQDVLHFVSFIEAKQTNIWSADYVRDFSIPAGE